MNAQNIRPHTMAPMNSAKVKAADQKYCIRSACGVMPTGQPYRGRSDHEQPLTSTENRPSNPAMRIRRTARDRVTCALPLALNRSCHASSHARMRAPPVPTRGDYLPGFRTTRPGTPRVLQNVDHRPTRRRVPRTAGPMTGSPGGTGDTGIDISGRGQKSSRPEIDGGTAGVRTDGLRVRNGAGAGTG